MHRVYTIFLVICIDILNQNMLGYQILINEDSAKTINRKPRTTKNQNANKQTRMKTPKTAKNYIRNETEDRKL